MEKYIALKAELTNDLAELISHWLEANEGETHKLSGWVGDDTHTHMANAAMAVLLALGDKEHWMEQNECEPNMNNKW